jgi:putative Holliday junction resolvase
MAVNPNNILALDVGSVRIGVALANGIARLPQAFKTLDATSDVVTELRQIIADEQVGVLVVGLPRNLDGQETAQTASVRSFVKNLEQFELPIHFQDEALTSRKAEAELEARGKVYTKGDIDALAATYILEEWLGDQPQETR